MMLWYFLYGGLEAVHTFTFKNNTKDLSPANFYLLGHTSRMPAKRQLYSGQSEDV